MESKESYLKYQGLEVGSKAIRSGNSFKLWYIFMKMYRENRYILTSTFRYTFGIGIGIENWLVSEMTESSENSKTQKVVKFHTFSYLKTQKAIYFGP